MTALGNILWIIFGGVLIFFLYLLGSFLLFISIIGIPFGIQALKLAVFSLSPFGKEVVRGQRTGGCLYMIINVFWILTIGIELAIAHLILALFCGVTIIGLPFAKQHIKLAAIAIAPFGVDIQEAKE